MKNYSSSKIIEHKKKTMTYGVGNPGPDLRQAQKPVNTIQIIPKTKCPLSLVCLLVN
jgi:hypothetical protein